jgi:hypothetical protein
MRWRFLGREITAKFVNGELLEKRQAGLGPDSRPSGGEGAGSRNDGAAPQTSSAAARRELIETAKTMEGGLWEAVEGYVEAVENGTWGWSTADKEFLTGQFTPETIAAYQKWRAAKLAESKK